MIALRLFQLWRRFRDLPDQSGAQAQTVKTSSLVRIVLFSTYRMCVVGCVSCLLLTLWLCAEKSEG